MATEFIPETGQAAETPTSGTTRRLPRRARGFYYFTEADVRAIVMRVGFSPEAIMQIQNPEQGINNQTYIVQQANGPDLVIKVRPVSSKSKTQFRQAGKNNPDWPRYTQELFGPYPNGDVSTLPEITRTLEAHGGLREHLARVQAWLRETMARHPDATILAVAHYGTIGLLGMLCEALRPEAYLAHRPSHLLPDYGSLLGYRRHEGDWERDFLFRNPLSDANGEA
jgi:hypothetical protein